MNEAARETAHGTAVYSSEGTGGLRGRHGRWLAAARALLPLLLVALPAASEAGEAGGPLRVRDQLLLGLGFLSLDPIPAEVLPQGRWRLELAASVTNTFAMSDPIERALETTRNGRRQLTLEELRGFEPDHPADGIYYLDAELVRATVSARRGFGYGIEVELLMPVVTSQGGFLDSFIDGFHSTFGFDPEGRTGVPRDSLLAYGRSAEGEFLVFDGGDFLSLGDLVVGAKMDLLPNGRDTADLAVAVQVKLPTGEKEHLVGSGHLDLGFQLLGARHYGRGTLHGGFGVFLLGAHEILDTDPQAVAGAFLAYERLLRGGASAVIQLTTAQTPFRKLNLEELERTVLQTTIGARWRLGRRRVLFTALTENFGSFDNTPDLGLHVGLGTTFD